MKNMKKYKTYYKSWKKRLKYLWRIKSLNLMRLQVHAIDWEKRINLCLGCKYINGNNCSVCECSIYEKTKLITEICPKEKWK